MDGAFDFAENPLGIPQLLQSHTMEQAQDEKSIMTYLAMIHEKYKDYPILVVCLILFCIIDLFICLLISPQSERRSKEEKYSFKINPDDLENGQITAIVDVEKRLRAGIFKGDKPMDPSDPSSPKVEFKLRAPSGEVIDCNSILGDGEEGTVAFTGREIGDHVLEMLVDGEVVDSKSVDVRAPEVKLGDGSDSGMVGQKSQFSVGFAKKEGDEGRAEHLTVMVKGPGGEEVEVEAEVVDGELEVGFVPQMVGPYEVKVLYRGVEVEKKEMNVYKLDWSSGSGDGDINRATVGVSSDFELGVDGVKEGDDVEVVLVGEGGAEMAYCKMVGEGEGGRKKYEYVPTEAGDFHLEVRVNGKPVGGQDRARPVEVTDLEAEWGGPGLEAAVAGERAEFGVSFFDGDCEMVKPAFPPVVKVLWVGEGGEKEEVEVDVIANEDGSVSVGYVPKKEGAHIVELRLGKEEGAEGWKDGGKLLKSKTVPVFDVMFDFGDDWERDEEGRAVLVVDVPKVVGVKVIGGGSKEEREKVGVVLRNVETQEDECCEWERKILEGGWRDCILCGRALGVHELVVVYDGDKIGSGGKGVNGEKREKEVMVKRQFLESFGKGLKVGVCGKPTHFFSIFREKEGGAAVCTEGRFQPKLAYKQGGDAVAVAVSEGAGKAQNGDDEEKAVNKVDYTPEKPGRVIAKQWYRTWEEREDEVRVFGVDIVGLGGAEGSVVMGVSSGFEVGVWDTEDGKGAGGWPEGVEVIYREGKDGKEVNKEGEGGDGRTKCAFTPLYPGEHTVEIRVDGEVLLAEPVKVRGLSFEVIGFGAEAGVVGLEGNFWVRCRDGETGEIVPIPEGLEVEVDGRSGPLDVMEKGEAKDGEGVGGRGFSYVPADVGKTQVRVKMAGEEVFKNEFDVIKFSVGEAGKGKGSEGEDRKVGFGTVADGGVVLVNDLNALMVEAVGAGEGGEGEQKLSLKDLDVKGVVVGKEGQSTGTCKVSGGDAMSYTVQEIGNNQVEVHYKGQKVCTVGVQAVGPVASGQGLETAFLGFPAKFVVEFPETEEKKKKKKGSNRPKKARSGTKLKEKDRKPSTKSKLKGKKGGEIDISRIQPDLEIDGVPVEVTAKRIGDRAVEFTYIPTTQGTLSLDITDNGKSFFSNKFPVALPLWTVSGSGAKFAKCDMENYFHVSATDPKTGDNLLGMNGSENVKCGMVGPDGQEVGVRCQFHPKRGMGGVYTPKVAGEHRVQIMSKDGEGEGDLGDGRVLHEFKVPAYRYDFDGDAMMGCCAKMEAKFRLEIYAEEGAPPLPPDGIKTTIKYVDSEGEVANLKEVRTNSDVSYSFTPMNKGEVEILVEHNGNVVYQGQLQVGLPRFFFLSSFFLSLSFPSSHLLFPPTDSDSKEKELRGEWWAKTTPSKPFNAILTLWKEFHRICSL